MSNQNPKELFKKTISLVLGVLIISFALSFWVVAWTEPVQNPPEGNAPSPLNVGGAGQTKQGWLATLESLWVGVEPGAGEGKLYAGVLRVLNGALINSNGAPNGLIVAQGNVGIGTLSPSSGSRMEVNGDIKLTGNTPAFKITNVADPTDNSDVATKGYVLAQSGGSCTYGLRFAGYTKSTGYTGNLGGPYGAANKCADALEGYPLLNTLENHVHWCSVAELVELGDQYTYSEEVWVRDAVGGMYNYRHGLLQPIIYRLLYLGSGSATSSLDEIDSTCLDWRSAGASYVGPILKTNGRLAPNACNSGRNLACCYYGEL